MTSNAGFFREREAAAVLKHGLLTRYPTVFASAAGQRSPRVLLLDGYAGRGRYEDGSPGSPMLLLDTAATTSNFRNVECVFVELNPDNFRELQAVVDERQADDVRCTALEGDLSDHLEPILCIAADAAVFAFLDPFGTALEYEELTRKLLRRPKHPPTEVLLHFSVNAIRRIGGLLRKLGSDPTAGSDADRKTIARADRFLGGTWWHPIAHDATDEPGVATRIAEEVARAYCGMVHDDTRYGSFLFPVRDRPDLAPEYFLVLFSLHPYGFWRFNDQLSKANVEWQEAWRGKANSKAAAKAADSAERALQRQRELGVMSLFDDDETDPDPDPGVAAYPPFDEAAEAKVWIEVIETNLIRLIEQGKPLRLINRIRDVYGEVLGLARETHVKKALGNLHARGMSPDDGKGGDFYKRLICP